VTARRVAAPAKERTRDLEFVKSEKPRRAFMMFFLLLRLLVAGAVVEGENAG